MSAMNKRLLISESRGDLNRCTPYRGKPNQHVTRFSRSVRVWSSTICISRGPRIAIFHESPTDLDGSHCSREKELLTQSTTRWLSDLWGHIQFLSQDNQWSGRLKLRFCRWQATRSTGLISPACDRYVQYLITGANTSVLNQHRRGLQPWRCQLSTNHSPIFLTDGFHFPPKGSAQSQVINQHITIWTKGRPGPKSRQWDPPLDSYRNLSSKHSMS
jgi:hypothetical protein